MSKKQLHWEDVSIGDELPALVKIATTQMLVKWAGAYGDFNPQHFDTSFAISQGIDKPIVHGQLKRAWLVQLLTDWIGDGGFLARLSCQVRAMDYPRPMVSLAIPAEGEKWRCRGRVTRKYIDADKHCVDCEIWIENGSGQSTTYGYATVVLPSEHSNRNTGVI